VHAWLRALAGSAGPAEVATRLNRFLFENTEPNRFVTLFYAELDAQHARLRYVNAGHVPPFVARRSGGMARLEAGGPVLGLLEGAAFEAEEVTLARGDVVAVVTDGATEALSPSDDEYGDERVGDLLGTLAGRDAPGILGGLLDAVEGWAGPRGCTDDLTALVLKTL
jgi:sigma-B regulation protein RsbU (phosphoserine phosphatase)